MYAKVAILFAILAAVNVTAHLHGAALVHTGNSITSRHQDAHGNYAFNYKVSDGHASVKSQSEVGSGYGHKDSAYSSHINHLAPAVAVGHAAPLVHAASHGHAAHLVHAAPLAHAVPLAVGHASPVAYSTSSVIKHVATAPVVSHVAAAPFLHAAPVAHSAPLAHAAPFAVAHGAPVAYSTSTAVHHVAPAPDVGHVAAAPVVAGHRLLGTGHLAYDNGFSGHGLLAHRFGGAAYGGLKSVHF